MLTYCMFRAKTEAQPLNCKSYLWKKLNKHITADILASFCIFSVPPNIKFVEFKSGFLNFSILD